MVFPAKCPKCDVKVFPFGHWWLRRGVPLAHGAAAKELEGHRDPCSCSITALSAISGLAFPCE